MFRTVLLSCFVAVGVFCRLTEQERVEEWTKNGNHWPPTWQRETDKMRKRMTMREVEIMKIPESGERWENWLQYTQSRYVKTFTPMGFKVINTPDSVREKLLNDVNRGIENWDNLRSEGNINVVYGTSKFVDMRKTLNEVHNELLPLHEAWAGGIKLRPTSIYGVRLYENSSSLAMHLDKVETHVISSIVHIAHQYDDDAEPWTLDFEAHDGQLHSLSLQPGQMVFYESAKCVHGRIKQLKGKYYGSVFVHYQPVDPEVWSVTNDDIIAAVPPHWNRGAQSIPNAPIAGAAITSDSVKCDGSPPRFGLNTRSNVYDL